MAARSYNAYEKQINQLTDQDMKLYKINVNSGVLDLKTCKTEPYQKEDLAFHKLPYDYNPDSKMPKLFAKFLTTSMNFEWDDKKSQTKLKPDEVKDYKQVMQFIQEFMGYTLVKGNRLHKNLIIVGKGRNGKSVLQEIWMKMVGPENASAVDLANFTKDTSIIHTKNKLINICDDIDPRVKLDKGIIKTAAAGGLVEGREMYKDPEWFYYTAKNIISCNETPYVGNADVAIKERFYLLFFDRVFLESERDPDLAENIMEQEMEQVFNWAIVGLQRLLERGRFDPPARVTAEGEAFMKRNDNVQQWIEEEKMADEGDKCKRKHLWTSYKDYCIDSNLRPMNRNRFYEYLQKKGYEHVVTNGYDYFKGLKTPDNITEYDR